MSPLPGVRFFFRLNVFDKIMYSIQRLIFCLYLKLVIPINLFRFKTRSKVSMHCPIKTPVGVALL